MRGRSPILSALVLVAGVACAQDTGHEMRATNASSPIADEVAALVDLLDASDWRDRNRAEEDLRALGPDAMATLEGRLRAGGLTPEQRTRIMVILKDLFLSSPRAAIGITFNTGAARRGPLVTRTEPGFQCHGVLRPGDIITAIGDHRFDVSSMVDETEHLRAAILSHMPGDWIDVTVLRDGTPLTLQIQLGRFGDLRGSQQPAPLHVLSAWSVRFRRLTGEQEASRPPLDCGLAPTAWRETASFPGPDADALVDGAMNTSGVVAGGQPSGRVPDRLVGIRPGSLDANSRDDASRVANISRLQGEIQRFERLLSAYEREQANQVARSTDESLTPAERAEAARLAVEYERAAREFREAIRDRRLRLDLLLRRE